MKPRGQSSNFKEVELPKAQSARARCYGVIDLGIVDNSYKSEEKTAHKIMLYGNYLICLQNLRMMERSSHL